MRENKVFISLENMVNNVANRHNMSKAQREVMYREWGGLAASGTVKFDENNNIIGFAPEQSINLINCTILVNPESGETEIV